MTLGNITFVIILLYCYSITVYIYIVDDFIVMMTFGIIPNFNLVYLTVLEINAVKRKKTIVGKQCVSGHTCPIAFF